MAIKSGSNSDVEYEFARTQIAVFFVILLLAVDSINPVKIFLHVFPSVQPWHVATLSLLLMTYVFISELKQLLYFGVKIFFRSILSIFFREVEVIGVQNIPLYGPVIFTGNHANQFIDSVVMLSTCQRTISYLIAEKSWKRRIIGDIAWAMGAVPVKRPMDSAFNPSCGTITLQHQQQLNNEDISNLEAKGFETKFLKELAVGDKIMVHGSSELLKVTKISSDTSMTLAGNSKPSEEASTFSIMKKLDQKDMYKKVLSKLASGGTIGIFPEGGSHDRTDLLPLKAGVSIIAHSALDQEGINVPIVPVGLNYFRGHRFRGRVIVEFGRPIHIDPLTMLEYKRGGNARRQVCNDFLERIEDHMRGVIVSAPDYQSLKLIYTARRLYRSKVLSSSEKQDLNRRFAMGYKHLLHITQGNPPKEWIMLQERIKNYQKELDELGIRDYQVPALVSQTEETDGDVVLREMRLPFRIVELILLVAVSLIPALFLNLPVGLIARLNANRKRKQSLAASSVKVKGMDVLLSEKVLLCIVLVPSLWMTYAVLLLVFTDLDGPAIALATLSMPLFSYMGIVTAEAGMIDLKDVKPYLMRLFPSTRRRLIALPKCRRELQSDFREFVKMIGPTLGEVYTEKKLDWAEFQKNSREITKTYSKDD